MSNPKKRRAEDGQPAQKSKKRKGGNVQADETINSDLGISTLFQRMDSPLLADYFAQKLSQSSRDLSSIELADLTVSANAIKDTTSWQPDRTLDNLPDFLEKFSGGAEALKKTPKQKGSPHTLVVAEAALRAADIVRTLRKLSGEKAPVAKLFAKHMKIKEQVDFLKKKRIGFGVGTPERVAALIEKGALSVDKLERIVVDASHIDKKMKGVMDMSETMMPLARLLTRSEIKNAYSRHDKPLALIFY